jgi:hypothetical protein
VIRQLRGRGSREQHGYEGLAPRPSVDEERFVTPDALDGRPVPHIDAEEALRKASPDVAVGGRADDDAVAIRGELDGDRIGAVVTVDRDVMRDEEAAGRSGEHLDRQVQRVTIDRRPAAHLDQVGAVLVQPATAVRGHLVGRWQVEQVAAVLQFDEDALAPRAQKPQIAARGRQQAVDAHMPLRHQRVEYAGHPRRGGQ